MVVIPSAAHEQRYQWVRPHLLAPVPVHSRIEGGTDRQQIKNTLVKTVTSDSGAECKKSRFTTPVPCQK